VIRPTIGPQCEPQASGEMLWPLCEGAPTANGMTKWAVDSPDRRAAVRAAGRSTAEASGEMLWAASEGAPTANGTAKWAADSPDRRAPEASEGAPTANT
jgi:hypothetical protein